MPIIRKLFLILAALGLAVPALAQDAVQTPYWASIRASEVNMRVGPGEDYRILWVYKRPALPLKVLRLKEGWRLVEDPDGAQGWVLARFRTLQPISSTRQLAQIVANSSGQKQLAVIAAGQQVDIGLVGDAGRGDAKLLWRLAPGVVGVLGDCGNGWCQMSVGPRKGFVPQDRIWGAGEP